MASQTVQQKSQFAVKRGTIQVFGKSRQPQANIRANVGGKEIKFPNGFYEPANPRQPKGPKKEAFFAADPIRQLDKDGRVQATTTFTFTPGKPKTDAQGKKVCTGVVHKMYWSRDSANATKTYGGVCDIQTGPKHWALQTQEGKRDLAKTPASRITTAVQDHQNYIYPLEASKTSAPLSAPLPSFQQAVKTNVIPPQGYKLRSSQVAVDATIPDTDGNGRKVFREIRFDRQYAENGQWKQGDQDFLVNTRYVHNPNGVYQGQITYAYTPGKNGQPGTITKTWVSSSGHSATRAFKVGKDNLTSLENIRET
jgi:hypothetical protein